MPFKNFSRSVAQALGANPAHERCVVSSPGGNGPQFLISHFAELIAKVSPWLYACTLGLSITAEYQTFESQIARAQCKG